MILEGGGPCSVPLWDSSVDADLSASGRCVVVVGGWEQVLRAAGNGPAPPPSRHCCECFSTERGGVSGIRPDRTVNMPRLGAVPSARQ